MIDGKAPAPRGVAVAWQAGGAGRVETIDGESVTVSSDKPFAPGARPIGSIASLPAPADAAEGAPAGPAAHEIRVKVHRCHKREDGLFEINGRLIDATRALRLALNASLAPDAT